MAGQVVGLDWPAVQVLLPIAADRDRLTALLRMFEIGMVQGASKTAAKDAP